MVGLSREGVLVSRTPGTIDNVGGAPAYQHALIGLIALSAFAPYVTGGFRVEHFAVYGLLALYLPIALLQFCSRNNLLLLGPWIGYTVSSLMGALMQPYGAPWPPGSFSAGLDNILLPLAAMLLSWSIASTATALPLLKTFGSVVVWGAAANAGLAIISTRVDLTPVLSIFWSPEGSGSVARNAATMGRFTGIVNQPAEAGLLYGVAGLLAIYLYTRKPKTMLVLLTLISTGGLLSVSKVFILGGIPFLLLSLWASRKGFGRASLILTAGLLIAGIVQLGFFQQWSGFHYLSRLRLVPQSEGLIEFYTAGRWNNDSTLLDVIHSVLSLSPLFGVGPSGWQVPYDSGLTEAFVVAGLAGVLFLALTHFSFFVMAARTYEPRRRTLSLLLASFLPVASFGIPSLTANRTATIVWITLGLLLKATDGFPKRETIDVNLRPHRSITRNALKDGANALHPGTDSWAMRETTRTIRSESD